MIPPGLFPQPRRPVCARPVSAAQPRRKKRRKTGGILAFSVWEMGSLSATGWGVGSEWPMVAHIRYNREVNLYCWVPDTELERIRHMAATTEHIDNGELYSPETTPPPIEPQEVVVIKNY